MSYVVLARKWRPRDFRSLVGQEHVVRALRHALEQQRLHHAYLFTGTRGVGKTTLARILAKCLNCERGVTPEPCGSCAACTEIDGGRFVDLLEVDAATNTRVDEMRQLLETAQYAPTRARYKVYVIDEVHMLSNSAFNAMLKTLEEPPAHLKFILATTDPQKIPVTVLSRCLQFNLKQMPAQAIASHLATVLERESVPGDGDALQALARAAGGSMRDALSLLDQAIAHGAGQVRTESVRDMLGSIDQADLLGFLDAICTGDAPALIQLADTMAERSLSFDMALGELAALLLRVAVAQRVPNGLEEDLPERERIAGFAERLDPEIVQLYYQIALQGRSDLPLAPDEHAGFLMTLLRMLAFAPDDGAAVIPASGGAARQAPPVGRSGESTPVGQPPGPGGTTDATSEWTELVRGLGLTGAARELARNAVRVGVDVDAFDLRVPKAKAHLADRMYVEKLRGALENAVGRRITLKVVVGDADGLSVVQKEMRHRDARQAAAVREVQQDQFVNDLVTLLDGSIVDSSIRAQPEQPG